MNELSLPFDYIPVEKISEKINPLISPNIITTEDVYLLWQQHKISLCFYWGNWYWNNVLIDLENIINSLLTMDYYVPRESSIILPFILDNKYSDVLFQKEIKEVIDRIKKIVDFIQKRNNDFICPEYNSYLISEKKVEKFAYFLGDPESWYDNPQPMRKFIAKPYNTECEFIYVNIPLKDKRLWVGDNNNFSHPHYTHYSNYKYWSAYQGFELKDLVLPECEAQLLIKRYLRNKKIALVMTDKKTKEHGNKERHAYWRESILLAAGYVKFNYPNECKNKHGKESCAAWAEALINHWHLFGNENDIPSIRFTENLIRDIFKLPNKRRIAGKSTY